MKKMTCFGFFMLLILSGVTMSPVCVADERRPAYDRMVEEVKREAGEDVKQKPEKQDETAEQTEEQADLDDNKRRPAYDRMVEEATQEADENAKHRQNNQPEAAEQVEKQVRPVDDGRVQAERKRLQTEMNKVRARGLDPNFTEGMRNSRLKELQSQLDLLNSDPGAYFD